VNARHRARKRSASRSSQKTVTRRLTLARRDVRRSSATVAIRPYGYRRTLPFRKT